MKKLVVLFTLISCLNVLRAQSNEEQFIKQNFDFATDQAVQMLHSIDQTKPVFPLCVDKEGKLVY